MIRPNLLTASISAALLALALSQPAWAQQPDVISKDSAEETAEEAADADQDAVTLEEVTVTGSRIKRAGFDTLEPAISISSEYIRGRGLTNAADALNELPGFGAGVTPEGGQSGFGTGVNFVNRFGLGSSRTLTLINGRRFVSSNPVTIFGPAGPGLQVDLNAIPTQLIERIDTIAVGGAPTYGSDAIAGVVNLILKKDYEGLEVSGTLGTTEDGFADRYNASVIWGVGFNEGRGNFTIGASADNIEGVLQSDVELFSRARGFFTNPIGSTLTLQPGRSPFNDGRLNPNIPFNINSADGIPNAVFIQNRRLTQLTPGGVLFPATGATNLTGGVLRGFGADQRTYLQFDPSGNLVPYNQGTPFGNTDASGGDGWDLIKTAQVTSDLERQNVNSTARFEFAPGIEGYFEGLFFRSKAFEIIDQPIFNATQFGGNSAALTFLATDPRLTPQAAARLRELNVTSFRLSRAGSDLVNNNAYGETDLYRGVLGLTWDFNIGDNAYVWDTSVTYGRSDADFFANVLDQQNFLNAINVTRNAAGQIVCDPTGRIGATGVQVPIADPNCVPLDLFGENRASAEAKRYVTGRTKANSLLKQTVFNSNIGGPIIDYWAGTLSANMGFEYRKEEGAFTPDAFQQAGRGRAVPIFPNAGEFDTKEFFAEFVAPLVGKDQDIPLVHSFDIIGKGRRVDNSVNGTFDAYTYGMQWRVTSDFEIRGNRTRSLRAPALTELFTPPSTAFFFINDPCDSRFINTPAVPGGPTGPGAARFNNCQAFFRSIGLSTPVTNFQSNAVGASVEGITSGDPNLRNEDSQASTFGFVWEPKAIPGFRMAIDYIEIDIRDAIVSPSATAIANLCYDDPNFNQADPRNGNEFCRRLNRNAAGQFVNVINPDGSRVPAVRTGFVNAATVDFRALQGELQYRVFTDTGWGFEYGFTAFNLRENSLVFLGIRDFADGELGNPNRQYQFSFSAGKDAWEGTLRANYSSAAVFDRTFTVETRDLLKVSSYIQWDLGVNYLIGEQGAVRLAVTNLFDVEPPFGTVGIGTYDILGRRYALTTEWRF